MNTFLALLAIIAITAADVSQVVNRYLSPNQQEQRIRPPSNERVETTIEKHEVIELPTQIEIIKDGQPIYGVPSVSKVEFARMSPTAEIRRPSQEIENLQPPQNYRVPYEMPLRSYLPPVLPETTTTEIPNTTTEILATTTEIPVSSTTPIAGEETTTEQPSTLALTTTEFTRAVRVVEATTMPTLMNHNLPPARPIKHYLPPTSMLANQYMPTIMLQNQYLTPTIPQDQYLPPGLVENRSLPTVLPNSQNLLPIIPVEISMQFEMPEIQYLPPSMPKSQYLPPVMAEDRSFLSRMPEHQHLLPTMLEEHSLPDPMTEDHILPTPMTENQYYISATVPENQYLPPIDMMIPPPLPMPQPTYQQYLEQLKRDQQQMYSEEQIIVMTNPKSQMEGQHVIAMEPQTTQMQPVAPVGPAHSFSFDGYHYKTGDEDLNRFRYSL